MTEGIGKPIRLRNGYFGNQPGTYWAWPIDGYYDLHHCPKGEHPDGSDDVGEGYATLQECRKAAREEHRLSRLFGGLL